MMVQVQASSSSRIRYELAPDGRSNLVITSQVPPAIRQAYWAARSGSYTQARQLLCDPSVEPLVDRSDPQVTLLLAEIYWLAGDMEGALQWLERTLEIEPHPLVLYRLGCIYKLLGRWDQGMEAHSRAYERAPDHPMVCKEYAADLMRLGRTKEGMDLLRRAVDLAPDNPQLHSQYLLRLSYLQGADPRMILHEHLAWASRHSPMHLARTGHVNDPDPDRRLRIGYISSSLREHATIANFEPFLEARDGNAFEVFGYGSVAAQDAVTERIKQKFDHYQDIRRLDDRAAADLIATDRIDILVAVGGHVPDNRLGVLAYMPAPVQVDFGALCTTGMRQVQYRFTDSFRDGPASEPLYVERPIYLAGMDCFKAPDDCPAVSDLPAHSSGFVRFACFNNRFKITDHILGLWVSILAHSPGSRLLLKFMGAEAACVRSALMDRWVRAGGDRAYLEIVGWVGTSEHLRMYEQVDIALDTFPYNGCMTTLEALWMGVPVVSRVGPADAYWTCRMGYSYLKRVGLECLAAGDDQRYVVAAVTLARRLADLAAIRQSLRARMVAPGGLCDARAYMRQVEAAYRRIWRAWCRQRSSSMEAEECGS